MYKITAKSKTVRAFRLLAVLVVLWQTAALGAQNDSLFCLRVKGRVMNAEGGCKVELITALGSVDSAALKNSHHKFCFLLKRNMYYAIRISKPGFLPRLVCIDTRFPEDIADLLDFAFCTRLISLEEGATLNDDALDFPVAMIAFDPVTEMFSHSKEYTEQNRRDLRTRTASFCSK